MENEVKDEEKTILITPIEEKKEEKPKRKGHGPLYWVIVIIGMGLIVYLSIGIGEKLGRYAELQSGKGNKTTIKEESNSNPESNVTTAKDSEIENFDAAKTTTEINDRFELALNWNAFEYDKNLFDNSNIRNSVVHNSLKDQAMEVKDENVQEGMYYVDYALFDQKHQLIFGTNYKTDVEIDDTITDIIGENKVMWLYSGVPSDTTLTATNINYDETNKCYVISGTFVRTILENDGKEVSTNGTFKLSYNKTGETRTLKSLIFTK